MIETPHWLRDHPRREWLFAAMRVIDEKAQFHLAEHNFSRPKYGEVSWGGGHFDAFAPAEWRFEFLRRLRDGDAPQEAAAKCKEYVREMVKKWNRSPRQSVAVWGSYELERWEGTADDEINEAARQVAATLEGPRMTTQKEMFAADQGAGRRAALRGALDDAEAAARETLAAEARLAEARRGFTDAAEALASCRRRQDEAQHALTLAAAALAGPDGGASSVMVIPITDDAPEVAPEVVPLGDEVVTLALPAEVAAAVGGEQSVRPAENERELINAEPPPKEDRDGRVQFALREALCQSGARADEVWARLMRQGDSTGVGDDELERAVAQEFHWCGVGGVRRPGEGGLYWFAGSTLMNLPTGEHYREPYLFVDQIVAPGVNPALEGAALLDAVRVMLGIRKEPKPKRSRKKKAGAGVTNGPPGVAGRIARDDALLADEGAACKTQAPNDAVGTAEPGKGRYVLRLWRVYENMGLPVATWWDDSADVLRRQAHDGAATAKLQGMYYQLRDDETGQLIDLPPVAPDAPCKTQAPAPADLENGPCWPAVCWLPGPLSCPPHLDAKHWDAVLAQLGTLPRWWGRSDDLTARLEQELVKSALRGTPFDDRDRAKIGAICHFREQCWATPVWHEWAEFDVSLPDATQVRCVYLADFGGFDKRHFMFKGDPEVLSDTGVWVTWAVRDNAAKEGEGVEQYAARVCAAAARAYAQKAKKRGRKHAPQTAQEGKA